ncbi:vWA domain-containing protein [Mycolicibacterium sp.]|uniref:vWA domain-containing protein n=1 Tax=Mycolicibacterium sp. TaxID=2320850 RepID=UPI003D0D6A1D
MSFDPVLPPAMLGAVGVVLVLLRLLALRRVTSLLRWGATTVALLALLVAAARPGTGSTGDAEAPAQGDNVFFVVDRSADSGIDDFGGAPRMSGIRDDITALMRSHPGARFAVIAFAARAALDWPLSADAWSLDPVASALAPDPGGRDEQVNAGAAANVLRYQLISAGQQYPQSDNLVYYFGSGAPGSSAPQTEFDVAAVDGGAVLGYGVGPALDETRLRAVAGQLGVPYQHRSPGEPLAPTVAAAPSDAATPAAGTSQRVEYYWLFTLFAALLLLGEIFGSARELHRSRAGARGVPR